MLLPKVKEFIDQVNILAKNRQAMGFKFNQTNIRESLAFMAFSYMKESDRSILTFDDTVLSDKYPIPVRIYTPAQKENLPVLIYLHGGGHMCGSVTVYDNVVRKITRLTGHIVVAIDYRLSPEFAYPVALNDCKQVIHEVFNLLDFWKIKYKSRELCIMGDSAGGALTASIIMDREFTQQHHITRQVLIYPSVDYTGSTESYAKYGTGYLLEATRMQWYFDNYAQNNEDRHKLSPLFNEFYSAMPETLVIVAEYDPLVDEGRLYHEKVQQASGNSTFIQVDGVIHAFFLMEDLCKEAADNAYAQMVSFLKTE